MTTCPIDLRIYSIPIREKYLIDENPDLAPWIIFGEHPDGTVDVHQALDGHDIFVGIERWKAEQLIAARIDFARAICNIVNEEADDD